jgi:hypothetical protein
MGDSLIRPSMIVCQIRAEPAGNERSTTHVLVDLRAHVAGRNGIGKFDGGSAEWVAVTVAVRPGSLDLAEKLRAGDVLVQPSITVWDSA